MDKSLGSVWLVVCVSHLFFSAPIQVRETDAPCQRELVLWQMSVVGQGLASVEQEKDFDMCAHESRQCLV